MMHIHHSYNQAQNNSIGKSLFKFWYGFQPLMSIELVSQPTSMINIENGHQEVEKALKFKALVCEIQKQA